MRFLADVGISPSTVAFLQGLEHDAVHLHALGLDRLPDSAILETAHEEERVVQRGYVVNGANLVYGYRLRKPVVEQVY